VEPIWNVAAQRFVDAAAGKGLLEVEAEMAAGAKQLAGGRPSFLQDVMKGRKTEIDFLNGYVCEQGRRVGMPTPFNDAVAETVRRHPVGALKPNPANLEPLLKLLPA
jgi:2-dehydropantoate 2-reductase